MQKRTVLLTLAVGLLSVPSIPEARMLVRISEAPSGLVQGLTLPRDGWRYLPEVDLYIVESEDALLSSLQSEGAVEFVEPEVDIELAKTPNDPLFSNQEIVYGDGGIAAVTVWDQLVGSGVVVAVIDTGVDLAHPDLAPNLWFNDGEVPGNGQDDDRNGFVDDVYGYDFAERDNDPSDGEGHGTHLAGVIGAVGDNGVGVAGVNWQVRLMPLKFTDGAGRGTTALAIEAIDYAIRNGADVINASWNVRQDGDGGGIEPLRMAIARATEAGILFVTASGNSPLGGQNTDLQPVYPASFSLPGMIAVASSDPTGGLSFFSNYGTGSIDLTAPGAAIFSTMPGGTYGAMSGTSVATAFVTGAAAMLLSVDGSLTPDQISDVILNNASQVPELVGIVGSGGRLNLSRAVAGLNGGSPPPSSVATDAGVGVHPAESPYGDLEYPSGGCSLVPHRDVDRRLN